MSYFKEDSPFFRDTLKQYEESLLEITGTFKYWSDKAAIAHIKGQEYCEALKDFYNSIEEKIHCEALSTYKLFLQQISEIMQTVVACNEGIVYSLSQVFPVELGPFNTNIGAELPPLKKIYEKLQKDVEMVKAQTITYKKTYAKKNPKNTEEHFLRLHSLEKQYELLRFDLYSFLSNNSLTGQLLAVEQLLALIYSIWSFTNTGQEQYKSKEKDLNKIAERISQSRKGLITMQESLRKEREVEEMKNMFTKIPQYKDDKSGYLWKHGNLITEWKRRFFYIKNSQLIYLREEEEIQYISLTMSKAFESKDHENLFAFEIVSVSPQKKVVLLAESDAEMKEWIYSLKKCSEQGLLGYTESEYTCADCFTCNPDWCSLNLGVLLCTNCSGIHRSLGSHISRVKSLQLDIIDPVIKELLIELHNNHQNIWGEGFRPPKYCSVEDKEEYIRGKYQHKSWITKIENPAQALVAGIKEKNVCKMFQAILSGAKVNENGVLHLAARVGSVHTVALLINSGWEIEGKNSEAFTPLEIALLANQKEIVEYIVKVISI
ncbi:hypothetical protein SteCoe_21427 [Stentor coeruleus]|uniref:Uncharacterized protein n=1 Tax=Stentor coeruleus TaxID=5963 RepID=A0A1R2BPP4_9CILI|nr:hypothetical protein SteCoe_21427 [Stentor coeruleus]